MVLAGRQQHRKNPSFVYTGQDSTLAVTLIATEGSCAQIPLTQTFSIQIQPSTFKMFPTYLPPTMMA
jgi:hypothetical protein